MSPEKVLFSLLFSLFICLPPYTLPPTLSIGVLKSRELINLFNHLKFSICVGSKCSTLTRNDVNPTSRKNSLRNSDLPENHRGDDFEESQTVREFLRRPNFSSISSVAKLFEQISSGVHSWRRKEVPKLFEPFFSAQTARADLLRSSFLEKKRSAQTVRAFLQCPCCSSRSPQEFIPGEEKCPNCSSRSLQEFIPEEEKKCPNT
ncbi:hypothetical protein CDAR_569161 [Caerostris darwini]|uniref:Uncharacterized protein n=1 Tax=Caerostris darwini TaxID=1538125 RepID=A0AAV4QA96_9ARAC|nr:hypothetical protein CDAR_569161 [Caerostris darwini]